MSKPVEPASPSKPDESETMSGPFQPLQNYLKANEKVHVAVCVTGIVGCLLLYGVLQVRTPPGRDVSAKWMPCLRARAAPGSYI
jgi:hypothetical protein